MASTPKNELTQAQVQGVLPAKQAAIEQLLPDQGGAGNVVGVGVGVKWSKGEPTGKPAVLVLVTHKVDESELPKEHLVAKRFGDVPTDVVTVGTPMAGGGEPDVGAQTLAKRIRPAEGGWSVGHFQITAGTLGTCVYDILPGGSTNPPAHGVGIPPRFYILSNNHVLANVNAAKLGDPILQPGPFDGGTNPADKIASLSRFIPIMLNPPTPLTQHNNIVDAAVAAGEFHD